MNAPASVDAALARVQESIVWLIRLGEFHRFHRGEAGGDPVLDRTTYLLLSRLADGGSLTMGEVAEQLDITPPTATRRVAPLVEAGLVHRERHPDSHRTVVITITEAGRARVAAVQKARIETLHETFRDWLPSELDVLASVLDRLTDTLAVELTSDDEFADRHLHRS
jgi:DNA-binding MarR family transcriptional regulator